MSRFRTRKDTVGVSLFPFLAVLICTMGALIVLLVLVVQLARVNASEDARTAALATPPDARLSEKQDYEFRIDLLTGQREQLQVEASDKRMELSHLEEHIRQLEREWEALRQAAEDLKQRSSGKAQASQTTQDRLRQLQQAVEEAEEQLEEARAKATRRPPLYSIVPYDGPNGTRRRPIYLECVAEGVVIQPEGVLFPLADFQGPLGPGNPLDAALRAIREYYARVAPRGERSEPYPLLVVRPEGVDSYGMARAAMRTWDDEFGYELIDDHMQLKYPQADPTLAQLIEKATADARTRQAALIAAMPSQYGVSQDVGFVPSRTRGGFVPESGTDPRSLGNRRGGFGRGGDSRYRDGQAVGRVDRQPAPTASQSLSDGTERGHAQGQPSAAVGTGCTPLADKRGRNWALPGANASATGIIRPLRVALLADRIILLPDQGENRTPEVVLIEGAMVDEMDEFVSQVWDRIEQWGMAVAGGYWKPVLNVQVAQGADARYQEMSILLVGSGLELQRSPQ